MRVHKAQGRSTQTPKQTSNTMALLVRFSPSSRSIASSSTCNMFVRPAAIQPHLRTFTHQSHTTSHIKHTAPTLAKYPVFARNLVAHNWQRTFATRKFGHDVVQAMLTFVRRIPSRCKARRSTPNIHLRSTFTNNQRIRREGSSQRSQSQEDSKWQTHSSR